MNPKAKEVDFIPEARQDVAAASGWYEEQSRGLGLEFLRCLEAGVLFIQRHPLMYPAVFGEYRRAILRRFPYAVFYQVEPDRVVVYAVFHCSQNPAKWRARLSN